MEFSENVEQAERQPVTSQPKKSKHSTRSGGDNMPPDMVLAMAQEVLTMLPSEYRVQVMNIQDPRGSFVVLAIHGAKVDESGAIVPRNAGNAGKAAE